MTTKDCIEKSIRNSIDSVRFDTDTRFYNESYAELIEIGSKFKAGTAEKKDMVNMVSGMLAWNQGAKHAVKLSRAIELFSGNGTNSFTKLVDKLKSIESNGTELEKPKQRILEVLELSQNSLGVRSVVIPSKFIHFISPVYFAMTDSNVSKGIKAGTNSRCGYIKYIQKLWELGFHEEQPLDDSLAAYWGASNNVTPMRAIDCTFYALGKEI